MIFSFLRVKKCILFIMLLSCPLCCKPHFKGVDSLRTTLVNVATAPLTCPICQETLKGLDKLTIHLFSHVNNSSNSSESVNQEQKACVTPELPHSNNNDIKEEFNLSYKKISMVKNQEVKEESPPIINQQPENENKDDDVIACDICSFTFTDRNILDMHQKLLHQTTPDEKTGKYSYHCHLCSKRFRMRGSLMVHLRVAHYGFSNHIDLRSHLPNNKEHNSENHYENRPMDVDSATKSTTKPQECKQWSCDVCAKMFTTKYFLKKHKRLHTGEMPYSCMICNKSFTFQQSYHKHMLYHSSEKPYVCNECGRAFKEHSTLQNHVRIHSGERPFGCETCGKRFRQRVSYLVHMRIHTGVMPYKCTACNKSFRYKVSQRSHKCPINPPGSVIRINDPDTNSPIAPLSNLIVSDNNAVSLNTDLSIPLTTHMENLEPQSTKGTKCTMTVDYDTGNINLIPKNVLGGTNGICNTDKPYQKTHGPRLISHFEKAEQNKLINDCIDEDNLIKQRDIYSMALSPILSEVESLCLNNNSPLSNPTSPTEENIQLIREKCLEELFQ